MKVETVDEMFSIFYVQKLQNFKKVYIIVKDPSNRDVPKSKS